MMRQVLITIGYRIGMKGARNSTLITLVQQLTCGYLHIQHLTKHPSDAPAGGHRVDVDP